MLRFILAKLLYLIPTMLGITLVAFGFIRLLPGDPVLLMAVADKESSFPTEVQARTPSATGLYQFI